MQNRGPGLRAQRADAPQSRIATLGATKAISERPTTARADFSVNILVASVALRDGAAGHRCGFAICALDVLRSSTCTAVVSSVAGAVGA
jgi:hypothetical protein